MTETHKHTPITITTADEFELAARLYRPVGPAEGTVIVNAGAGTPQGYYGRFAGWLRARGFTVITYDYRGIGDSRPASLRGFHATMSDWAEDTRAVYRWAAQRYPTETTVFVGHSFGGQLIGLVDELRDTAGAVLVASQLGAWRNWRGLARWKVGVFWHFLVPVSTAICGYLPRWGGLGAEMPAGVARQWRRWALHPDYVMGHDPHARTRYGRFDRPTLVYSFSDDDIAPRAAVDHLLGVLGAASITHHVVKPADIDAPKIGHFGFFRPALAERLWSQVLGFVREATGGRAGADAPILHAAA